MKRDDSLAIVVIVILLAAAAWLFDGDIVGAGIAAVTVVAPVSWILNWRKK